MRCKHCELIRIRDNKQEYYCKAKDREISELECRDCMLFILEMSLKDVFGKGFKTK